MYGVWQSGIVDKAHDSLATAFNEECGTRSNAIVPHKICLALVWIYLLLERYDVDLIVVDWVIGHWVGDSPSVMLLSKSSRFLLLFLLLRRLLLIFYRTKKKQDCLHLRRFHWWDR